jgi:hypothetical protein
MEGLDKGGHGPTSGCCAIVEEEEEEEERLKQVYTTFYIGFLRYVSQQRFKSSLIYFCLFSSNVYYRGG